MDEAIRLSAQKRLKTKVSHMLHLSTLVLHLRVVCALMIYNGPESLTYIQIISLSTLEGNDLPFIGVIADILKIAPD